MASGSALGELTGLGLSHQALSRAHVLTTYSDRLVPLVRRYLATVFRTNNIDPFPSEGDWLKSLTRAEPDSGLVKDIGNDVWKLFQEYLSDVADGRLVENSENEFRSPQVYDFSRLFMLALDRAIAGLPWGRGSNLMARALNLAANDIEIGQLQGVQHYFFESRTSLLRPSTHDAIEQISNGSIGYKRWKDEGVDKTRVDSFAVDCRAFFEPKFRNVLYIDKIGAGSDK